MDNEMFRTAWRHAEAAEMTARPQGLLSNRLIRTSSLQEAPVRSRSARFSRRRLVQRLGRPKISSNTRRNSGSRQRLGSESTDRD